MAHGSRAPQTQYRRSTDAVQTQRGTFPAEQASLTGTLQPSTQRKISTFGVKSNQAREEYSSSVQSGVEDVHLLREKPPPTPPTVQLQ
ncbi:Uncharacterized protein DAT39_021585 [Clarias magur]|uniref:Uncharacterized protein n=1 Tax=Clarias magur TaxID=1594786 RepID=A0A8J4WS51_CLAMG|nr:Uncharacterized protein DAT39_021585 [Clarias magur]